MSDMKALEAQVSLLIKAGFSQVESARQVTSSVEVVSSKLGRLCDELREYMTHTDDRIRESEGKIRMLDSRLTRVEQELKPVVEAEKSRRAAANSSR